eukprot:540904_1
MLALRCLPYKYHPSTSYIILNIRSFTQKKKETETSQSFLSRDTSVLTQGSVLSHRDPSKLRSYNQQIDEHSEYQDPLLPDMPFKYDDESLIISPTIKNNKQPIRKSMQYNNNINENEDNNIYPQLEYFNLNNIKQYEQPLNYINTKSSYNKSHTQIKPSHSNINIRLQRLFYSDKSTQQPSENTIKNVLSNSTIDENDIRMSGENTPYNASEKQKQLQYEALKMEQEEDEEEEHEEDEDFSFEKALQELDQDTSVPNFRELYPDDNEREIEIDRFLKKAPEIAKTAVPPDAVILPVYGELKDYSKMLNIERNILSATLRHLGIYTHNVITQEAGQKLVEHLRPNTEIILEKLVDEVIPRMPYNKHDENYYKLNKRKPVLCILGHVDHGKTTLLDYLRHSHVAEGEAGGITQSIGAFTINMIEYGNTFGFESHYDQIVVFDTPGHAAFTGMRQRGAHVVDLGILVIDACDGIKPQTKESLAIIRREQIPFIIAINKIDRLEADPTKIKKELSELGVYSNDIEMIEISAKTGEGIGNLLEMIDILCELEDPRGNNNSNAELVVIEAKKSAQQGTVVNALVQDGLLKKGDNILKLNGFDKDSYCKISRLHDEYGNNIDTAGPSTAVSFLGFQKVLPEVGTILIAANDDKHANDIIHMRQHNEYFINKLKIHARVSSSHPKLHDPTIGLSSSSTSRLEDVDEDNLDAISKWSTLPHTNDPRQLNIWIRADTWGSIEALENYLYQIIIPNDEYYFQIISKDVGSLYENVIRECDSRNCFILNFNVPIKKGSYKVKHVEIFDSNIIFDLFNKFIETLENKLQPIEKHILCGKAYVREIFEVKDKENNNELTKIAGCIIETGKIKYDGHFRIKRNNKIIYEQWGVSELKHFAINVDQVEAGDECGLKLEFKDWKEEDYIECLDIIQEKNKIAPPIFDLDPDLQKTLYHSNYNVLKEKENEIHIHESRTVFSYEDEFENDNDNNEFIGDHKNTSHATRVIAKKVKPGKYVFETVDE